MTARCCKARAKHPDFSWQPNHQTRHLRLSARSSRSAVITTGGRSRFSVSQTRHDPSWEVEKSSLKRKDERVGTAQENRPLSGRPAGVEGDAHDRARVSAQGGDRLARQIPQADAVITGCRAHEGVVRRHAQVVDFSLKVRASYEINRDAAARANLVSAERAQKLPARRTPPGSKRS